MAKKDSNPFRNRGLLPADMPDSAPIRVRQRIKRLLEDRGRTQRDFAQWVGHGDQWASNLLRGEFALSMDDLDRAASFFNVPPSEIVRVSEDPWELSPTEMRVVRALRMLPPPIRDHVAETIDYMIGAYPDEAELLSDIRALNPDNHATLKRWVDSLRRGQERELTAGELDVLLREVEPPAAPGPRNRRGRMKAKPARKSG